MLMVFLEGGRGREREGGGREGGERGREGGREGGREEGGRQEGGREGGTKVARKFQCFPSLLFQTGCSYEYRTSFD